MKKVIISLMFCILSVSIHAQDFNSLSPEQRDKIVNYIAVAITKNAMSNAQNSSKDRQSYETVFSIIGEDSVEKCCYKEFKAKIEGKDGENWKGTKRKFWNYINDTLRNPNDIESILGSLKNERFQNCRPGAVEGVVRSYADKILKQTKFPDIQKNSQHKSSQSKKPNHGKVSVNNTNKESEGFSMLELLLSCVISFILGIVASLFLGINEKIVGKKTHKKEISEDDDVYKEVKSSSPQNSINSRNKGKGQHVEHSGKNVKQGNNKSNSNKPNLQNNEVKTQGNNIVEPSLDKKEVTESDVNNQVQPSLAEEQTLPNNAQVEVENVQVANEEPKQEKQKVIKYLRKLYDDIFTKVSASVEIDSYFCFDEDTLELTVVRENVGRILNYGDDVLTSFVAEIESKVFNPKDIQLIEKGKVEKVQGGYKIVKKVKVKLV